MEKVINNALAYIGKKFDEVVGALNKQQPSIEVKMSDMPPVVLNVQEISDLSRTLSNLKSVLEAQGSKVEIKDTRLDDVIGLLEKLVNKKQPINFGADVALLTEIKSSIVSLSDTIKDNKTVVDMSDIKRTNELIGQLSESIGQAVQKDIVVDMSELKDITSSIDNLSDIMMKKGKEENPQLNKLIDLMEKVAKKKFVVPDTFKLEENQLRQLRTGGTTVVGGGSGGSMIAATKATMANVAMAAADTEYSYTLPKGTTSFYIKIRSQNTKLLFAWAQGKLPGSGDGTAYMTIPQNGMQSRPGLDLSGKTIYFESAGTTQVCEIESYQ